MFTSWLRRDSLKRKPAKRSFVVQSSGPNIILLLTIVGFFVAVGIFVLQQSYAAGTLFGH
jgi:hypothetical protein